MRTKPLLLIMVALSLVGCATQEDFEALKKRVDKIEATKQADRDALQQELSQAETDRLGCRALAEQHYNASLAENGTPVKGKAGWYSANREELKALHEEEAKAYDDCQREYEDALQIARLKYGR